ncbi:MAG: J domain-containing protein [Scytonematopsis contorta HA4267-MV1]|jgi:hypothetical protein|nr:J domain-containing protein [Scytonematopsis contorta HA4267-MV1]
MPRKASSPKRTTSTTVTLALSEAHIRLQALEKEHEKLLKNIRKKRTELTNLVDLQRSIATEVYQRATPWFQKMANLDQEIHGLFEEIFNTKKLGKKLRKKVEKIYLNLQILGVVSPKIHDPSEEIEDEVSEDNGQEEDFFRSARERAYQQQQSGQGFEKPSFCRTDDSKKVRSLFLKLAEIFHPDKITDPDKHDHHTEIMKEINKAYQEGDLARLLEIEQLHEVGESTDISSEDDLTRACSRIEQQNELLKKQFEDLKSELRSAKKTPEGTMATDYKKICKLGIDPIDQMLEQIETQVDTISNIRDFVKDFREEKISTNEFINGPTILRQMDDDIFDLDDMVVYF